jgi:hypothetical protein
LEILAKIAVIVWGVHLLVCYVKGARMWAPYYTLEDTPEEWPWRTFYAVVTLGILGATCYWLVVDLLS